MDLSDLKNAFHGNIADDEATLEEYSHDYSIFEVKPEAVVFPKDTNDVKYLVKFANEKKKSGEQISLTARSAGTDMTGGPLTDSIVVEFTKYFNHVKEIATDLPDGNGAQGGGHAIVEPGVYFRDFEKELDKVGLLYPPYPASKDLCAMGGIVNNNSGGELTLQYGKTEDYVEEMDVVLADGELHHLAPLVGTALQKKLEGNSFEGDVYRKIFKLIEDNYDVIKNAKPRVSKNSSGYFLWNVWDKTTFNLVKLFVGAQGTLGLMTEAKLRVVPKPKFSRLMVVFAHSLDPVPTLVESLLPFHPESIESFDDRTLSLALRFFPSLLRLMKGNIIKLAFQFLPEFFMVLRSGFPKMIILIEVASDDEKELDGRIKDIEKTLEKFPVDVRAIKSKAEEQKYWTIRRQSFALLHSHVKGKYAAPFVDDLIVKPEFMPEFLPKVNAILDRYKSKLIYTIAGHPGNGNYHIIPLVDLSDPETRKIIPEITEEINKLVFQYHGSMSAEHNDGLIRSPYLPEMYGEKMMELFREVKNIFDPLGIFNPHKKSTASFDYSNSHMRTKI